MKLKLFQLDKEQYLIIFLNVEDVIKHPNSTVPKVYCNNLVLLLYMYYEMALIYLDFAIHHLVHLLFHYYMES